MSQKDNIKSMIELLISNIDEFGCKFVTYKAESMKELLENTLEYIKDKEQELDSMDKVYKALSKEYSITFDKENDLYEEVIKLKKEREEKLYQIDQICEKYSVNYVTNSGIQLMINEIIDVTAD